MRTRVLLFFVTTGLLVASALPATAQRTTASLRGTITDATKAIVPGASVTVTNQDTGFNRTVTTSPQATALTSSTRIGGPRGHNRSSSATAGH